MSTTTTEADPTREEVVGRAAELRELIAANAAVGEEQRRVADETVEAILEAGLIRLLTPRRFGGYEAGFQTFFDVGMELGRGDGSAGWIASLYNISAWMLGTFPEQAQLDVWGESPDVPICSIVMPTATTEPVDGGIVVDGRWGFGSGSAHAGWLLGMVPLPPGMGPEGDTALALIPMNEVRIEDTWHVAGMRATGSNTLVVENLFVPEHRLLPMSEAMQRHYRTEHSEESLYRSTWVPALAIILLAPQIGMAQAALDFVTARAATRGITYTSYERQTDSVGFQLQIAEAANRIESAYLLAQRSAAAIDEAAAANQMLGDRERARVRMDVGSVARLCREAIDVLLSAYGTSAFAESCPLQRIWRDQEVASRHGFVNTEISSEVYGRAVLGVEETATQLV